MPFLHICVCVVYVLPLECLCEYLLMNYKIRILARLDVFLHKSNPAITAFIFVLEFHLTNSVVLSLLVYLDLRAKKTESRIHPPREEIIHLAQGGTDAYQETSGSPHTSNEGK